MLRPLCLILLALAPLCRDDAPASQPARDDAPALARQLNRSSAVVTLAPGAYRVASPIALLNVHDLTVFAYDVRLTADKTQPGGVRVGDTLRLENCRNVTILGLSIDGNRRERGLQLDSYAVMLLNSNDMTLRDCSFTGAVCDSVMAWGGLNPASADLACQRLTLDSCRFRDFGRNGVSLVGAAWSTVIGCDFEGPGGNPGVAIDVEANTGDPDGINHHLLIANNRARNLNGAFWTIKTANPHHVSIVGNLSDGMKQDAVFVEGQDCLIANNIATNYGRCAVSVCNGGTASVSGNPGKLYLEPGNTLDGVLCAAAVTVTK